MKIVLFGATGNIGRRILREALQRGHSVTGVVRDPNAVQSPDPRVTLVQGDATDSAIVAKVVPGADANVSRRRYAADRRGAGSLEVSPGVRLMDLPSFPPAYMGKRGRALRRSQRCEQKSADLIGFS